MVRHHQKKPGILAIATHVNTLPNAARHVKKPAQQPAGAACTLRHGIQLAADIT